MSEWIISTEDINDITGSGFTVGQKLVRCKDCKYLSLTTLGMEYACWHGAIKVYGETGKECDYTVCQRITNPEHYCSYGEMKDDAGV